MLITQMAHMGVRPVAQTDNLPPAGRLKNHISTWKVITRDLCVLRTIHGYQVDFLQEPINSGGGRGTSGQRSHKRSVQPLGRVLLKPVPCPKKGRRTETSDKPKSSEQFGSHRAFQDGGNPHPQRPC